MPTADFPVRAAPPAMVYVERNATSEILPLDRASFSWRVGYETARRELEQLCAAKKLDIPRATLLFEGLSSEELQSLGVLRGKWRRRLQEAKGDQDIPVGKRVRLELAIDGYNARRHAAALIRGLEGDWESSVSKIESASELAAAMDAFEDLKGSTYLNALALRGENAGSILKVAARAHGMQLAEGAKELWEADRKLTQGEPLNARSHVTRACQHMRQAKREAAVDGRSEGEKYKPAADIFRALSLASSPPAKPIAGNGSQSPSPGSTAASKPETTAQPAHAPAGAAPALPRPDPFDRALKALSAHPDTSTVYMDGRDSGFELMQIRSAVREYEARYCISRYSTSRPG